AFSDRFRDHRPENLSTQAGQDRRRTDGERIETAAIVLRPPGRGAVTRPFAQRSLGVQLLWHHTHAGPGDRAVAEKARRQRRGTETSADRPRRRIQAGALKYLARGEPERRSRWSKKPAPSCV